MITLPNRQNKTIVQSNRSTIAGDIVSSFNLDLQNNPGAIRVARRLKLVTKTGDSGATNLGIPVGYRFFDGRTFTVAGSRVFANTGQDLNSAFSEDASSGALTTYDSDFSDLENFNDTLVTSASTTIQSKARDGSGTGAWTARTSSLSLGSGVAHILRYFTKFDRLYVTDSRSIKSVDTSWAVSTSAPYYLSLGTFSSPIFSIVSMEVSSDRIWIGIIRDLSPDGSAQSQSATFQASVMEWDGVSSVITKEYPIDGASGILSMKIKNDYPVIVDSNGIVREYSGYGFKEVDRFPISLRGYLGFPTDTGNSKRFIHPNGMAITQEGTVLINVCNRNGYLYGTTETVPERMPSGIWELSDGSGLVHKHSFSYMPVGSTSVTDYGQNRILKPGAIAIQKMYTTGGIVNTIIAGCEYYTNATSTTKGIFVDASYPSDNATYPEGQKSGYFVTRWFFSFQLKEIWKKAYAKFKQFLASSDKVVVKYRIREAVASEISITWVNTTSFTTATDVSALTGYEVEVLQGTGSGKCVHISSVSGSGPYTVTVDDVVTGVTTGTAKARLQNWTKIGVANDQVTESHEFAIGKTSERLQVKVYMEFTGDDEIYETLIISSPNEKLE